MNLLESHYYLYASIDKTLGGAPSVIAVTSSAKGEGKTTVAANLAMAASRAGRKTALVDLNLRNPAVAAFFGKSEGKGVISALKGEALQPALINAGWGSIVTAGQALEDPVPLIKSDRLGEIIAELKAGHDIVILDTPALGDFADGAFISERADFVVHVVGYGEVPAERVKSAISLLGGKRIGITLNKAREK